MANKTKQNNKQKQNKKSLSFTLEVFVILGFIWGWGVRMNLGTWKAKIGLYLWETNDNLCVENK